MSIPSRMPRWMASRMNSLVSTYVNLESSLTHCLRGVLLSWCTRTTTSSSVQRPHSKALHLRLMNACVTASVAFLLGFGGIGRAQVQSCCSAAEDCLARIQQVKGAEPSERSFYPPEPQNCAAAKLATFGPSVIPRLAPLLFHRDARVRDAAALALDVMGFGHYQVIEPAFHDLLAACDRDPPALACSL